MQAKDESEVPLTINCWPSASGADSYVNIEYESNASFDLQDIVIAIPLPALASSPKVNQVNSVAAGLQIEHNGFLILRWGTACFVDLLLVCPGFNHMSSAAAGGTRTLFLPGCSGVQHLSGSVCGGSQVSLTGT